MIGWGGDEQVEKHRGLEGKETTLCDTVMAGTCYYAGTSSTLTEGTTGRVSTNANYEFS